MNTKHRQAFYLILAILGLCVTWYYGIQMMQSPEGLSWTRFIRDSYVTLASTFVANDIIVVGIGFLFWSFFEARRLQMKLWIVYALLGSLVALAFAFPLFLLMRERKLAVIEANSS